MVHTPIAFPQPFNGWRLIEISWFQECGTTNWGGEHGPLSTEFPDRTIGEFIRRCE